MTPAAYVLVKLTLSLTGAPDLPPETLGHYDGRDAVQHCVADQLQQVVIRVPPAGYTLVFICEKEKS